MTRLPTLGPHGEGWVFIQGLILLTIALGATLGPSWAGPARVVTSVIGIVAIVSGLSLVVRGGRDLRDALTPLPYPRPSAELVTTGVYALVRHPIYGGLIVASSGWGLLTASPTATAMTALLFGFFELKSRREEVWLEGRFPDYAAYRARTRRLIPWIG